MRHFLVSHLDHFVGRFGWRWGNVVGGDIVGVSCLASVGDEYVLDGIVIEVYLKDALFFGVLGTIPRMNFTTLLPNCRRNRNTYCVICQI